MSVRKECNKCGQKISIRKMPNGHWVPFDYNTNSPHKCNSLSKKKPVKPKVAPKGKTITQEKMKSNTTPVKKLPQDPKPDKVITPYYINQNSPVTILPSIRSAIENGNDVIITYYTTSRDAWTQREITPYKVNTNTTGIYIEAYCHLRKEDRTFRLDKIKSVEVVDQRVIEELAAHDITIEDEQRQMPLNSSVEYGQIIEILIIIILFVVIMFSLSNL